MAYIVKGRLQVIIPKKRRVQLVEDLTIHVLNQDWPLKAGQFSDLGTYTPIGWIFNHPLEGALAAVWHDERCEKKDIPRQAADQGWFEIAIVGENKDTRMNIHKAYWDYCFMRVYALSTGQG